MNARRIIEFTLPPDDSVAPGGSDPWDGSNYGFIVADADGPKVRDTLTDLFAQDTIKQWREIGLASLASDGSPIILFGFDTWEDMWIAHVQLKRQDVQTIDRIAGSPDNEDDED